MMKREPERMCAACRQMKAKGELIRISLEKGGEPQIDLTGKAEGRGAYLCKDPECLKLAEKKNLLARSLHRAVPSELYCELEALIGE